MKFLRIVSSAFTLKLLIISIIAIVSASAIVYVVYNYNKVNNDYIKNYSEAFSDDTIKITKNINDKNFVENYYDLASLMLSANPPENNSSILELHMDCAPERHMVENYANTLIANKESLREVRVFIGCNTHSRYQIDVLIKSIRSNPNINSVKISTPYDNSALTGRHLANLLYKDEHIKTFMITGKISNDYTASGNGLRELSEGVINSNVEKLSLILWRISGEDIQNLSLARAKTLKEISITISSNYYVGIEHLSNQIKTSDSICKVHIEGGAWGAFPDYVLSQFMSSNVELDSGDVYCGAASHLSRRMSEAEKNDVQMIQQIIYKYEAREFAGGLFDDEQARMSKIRGLREGPIITSNFKFYNDNYIPDVNAKICKYVSLKHNENSFAYDIDKARNELVRLYPDYIKEQI